MLVSAIYQHELIISIHMSPPSWTSFPLPTLSHTSRLSKSPSWSSLSYTEDIYIYTSPFLLLPSIFPSISVFSSELVPHIRWPKYWSFSFSINPSNEYSGLISFRMAWFDLLAVQGTFKNLIPHHSSKA